MRWLGKLPELLGSLGLNSTGAVSFRNRIRNGNFTINQRGVSGTVTLATGVYGHDGFRAGANGASYTFATAANGDVTLTGAGSGTNTLVQIVGGKLYLPEGGTYVLSWTGTATARAYQGSASGSYAASPIVLTGLTAGTNLSVEFNLAGGATVGLLQLEPGATTTAFERRDDEIQRNQRYLCVGGAMPGAWGPSATVFTCGFTFPVPMATTPALILLNGSVNGGSALEPSVAQRTVSGISGSNVTAVGARVDLNTATASSTFRAGILEAGTLAFTAEI